MIKDSDMLMFFNEKELEITKLNILKENFNNYMTVAAEKIIILIITVKKLDKINILHAQIIKIILNFLKEMRASYENKLN